MHFLTLRITGNGIPFQDIEAAVGRAAQFAYRAGETGETRFGQVTYAVRDTEMDGINIKEGDVIGIASGRIEVTGKSADDICEQLIDKISDDDTEFLNLYYGEGVTEEQARELAQKLEDKFADVEVSVKYGGQPLYYYIVSAE